MFPITQNIKKPIDESEPDWLKAGKSFYEPQKRQNINNYLGEDLNAQSKKFFNIETRKKASDFIQEEKFSDNKLKKKIKKKEKKKKEKIFKKTKNIIDISLEENKNDDISYDFQYRKKIGEGLYTITIMRFGDENHYKFGLKVSEVPKFRRLP